MAETKSDRTFDIQSQMSHPRGLSRTFVGGGGAFVPKWAYVRHRSGWLSYCGVDHGAIRKLPICSVGNPLIPKRSVIGVGVLRLNCSEVKRVDRLSDSAPFSAVSLSTYFYCCCCWWWWWWMMMATMLMMIECLVVVMVLIFSRPYGVVRSRLWYDVLSVCLSSVVCLSVTFCIVAKRYVVEGRRWYRWIGSW